jgi:hypothetical protein
VKVSTRTVTRVLILEAVTALMTAVVMVDISAHARAQEGRGPNIWGYRGVARVKAPGPARVAVVGGSAAYSVGVDWLDSFPHNLTAALNQGWRKGFPGYYTDVINLAAVGDGAASYTTTLTDYAYLKPDIVCIYDGYDPVMASGAEGVRHASTIFKKTGYLPLLGAAQWEAPGRAAVDPFLRDGAEGDVSCNGGSRAWCKAMLDTVEWALSRQLKVVVVTPPHFSKRHAERQASLVVALDERFGNNPRIRHVSVAEEVDLHDPAFSFDGVYLTPRGNQRAGERVVDTIFALLAQK